MTNGFDPGVAAERTSFAWVRTGLGLAGCALLTGRLATVQGTQWAVGAAIAAAMLAFGVLGWSHDRYRRATHRLRLELPVDHAGSALLLTLAVGLIGVLALLLITL